MSNNSIPVYNKKTVFVLCDHELKIMSISDHPFGRVYLLNCRPHCCTHPNGIEMKIGEKFLSELVENGHITTTFLRTS